MQVLSEHKGDIDAALASGKMNAEQKWWIPVTFRCKWELPPSSSSSSTTDEQQSKPAYCIVNQKVEFEERSAEFELTPPVKGAKLVFAKANADGIGFYRVFYADKGLLTAVQHELTHPSSAVELGVEGKPASDAPAPIESLSETDCMGLLADTFAIYKQSAGKLMSIVTFLSFATTSFVERPSFMLWQTLLSYLRGLMILIMEGIQTTERVAKEKGVAVPLPLPADELVKKCQSIVLRLVQSEVDKTSTSTSSSSSVAEFFSTTSSSPSETVEEKEAKAFTGQLRMTLYQALLTYRYPPAIQELASIFDSAILPSVSDVHVAAIYSVRSASMQRSVQRNSSHQTSSLHCRQKLMTNWLLR